MVETKNLLKSFDGSYVLVFPNRQSLPVLRLSTLFPRFENPMTSILLRKLNPTLIDSYPC